jgi:hypothetical protein
MAFLLMRLASEMMQSGDTRSADSVQAGANRAGFAVDRGASEK